MNVKLLQVKAEFALFDLSFRDDHLIFIIDFERHFLG
jgi:hypothetical protein